MWALISAAEREEQRNFHLSVRSCITFARSFGAPELGYGSSHFKLSGKFEDAKKEGVA